MLWACLLFPSLPLEVHTRALLPEDAPEGRVPPFVVTSGGPHPRVVAANTSADDAGVQIGQSLSAALALVHGLSWRDRDFSAEAAALAGIAAWATQFTPTVSLAAPDAVLAEIGGSLRLFGGLPRLAAQLAGVGELGFHARLACAPTPTAALLLARAGREVSIVDPARLTAAVAPLPLVHRDLDDAVLATLAATGVKTFGEACALPRAELARRVGTEFVASLDRARGHCPDPRTPFVPPPRYVGRLELPAAIEDVAALSFAVNRLVCELCGWLLGRGLGILELVLDLVHERHAMRAGGAPATRARFALAAPSREPAHLTAVLRERLARVALPAPVVAIALSSEVTSALPSRSLGLLPGDDKAPTVPLLDRLRARLGDEALLRVRPRAEHRPEHASTYSANAGATSAPRRKTGSTCRTTKSSNARRAKRTLPAPPVPPRPLWLLAEPQPLGHLLEAQPWVLRDGPERIESGWWDGVDVRRDYFVAENPRGEILWIYRDHRYGVDDGEWFLHGVFA